MKEMRFPKEWQQAGGTSPFAPSSLTSLHTPRLPFTQPAGALHQLLKTISPASSSSPRQIHKHDKFGRLEQPGEAQAVPGLTTINN